MFVMENTSSPVRGVLGANSTRLRTMLSDKVARRDPSGSYILFRESQSPDIFSASANAVLLGELPVLERDKDSHHLAPVHGRAQYMKWYAGTDRLGHSIFPILVHGS